jgi:hypothetical protein
VWQDAAWVLDVDRDQAPVHWDAGAAAAVAMSGRWQLTCNGSVLGLASKGPQGCVSTSSNNGSSSSRDDGDPTKGQREPWVCRSGLDSCV